MLVLPASSIPQCELNRHEDTYLELFQATGRIKSTSIEAYQVSKKFCKVWSLKSLIKTSSFFEDIITFSNEVFKDFVFDLAVGN